MVIYPCGIDLNGGLFVVYPIGDLSWCFLFYPFGDLSRCFFYPIGDLSCFFVLFLIILVIYPGVFFLPIGDLSCFF